MINRIITIAAILTVLLFPVKISERVSCADNRIPPEVFFALTVIVFQPNFRSYGKK